MRGWSFAAIDPSTPSIGHFLSSEEKHMRVWVSLFALVVASTISNLCFAESIISALGFTSRGSAKALQEE
jgi:hypothetical protein